MNEEAKLQEQSVKLSREDMGCLKLTNQDYYHVHDYSEKSAYSRIFHQVPVDTDGNLLSDGKWQYTWNGENRLIAIEAVNPVAGSKKLTFKYDYMGRRTEKNVYTHNGTSWNTTADSTLKYVYEGYYQIAEFDGSGTLKKSYLRSGGEIYAVTDTVQNDTYFYMMDGNKNVMALIDSAGTVQADYSYDPFGRILSQSGSYADTNPFRFSSEYHDNETGLIYYNYRYYSPERGRWINRDPIEEEGGYNLYGFVGNNPISLWDYLGRDLVASTGPAGANFNQLSQLFDIKSQKTYGKILNEVNARSRVGGGMAPGVGTGVRIAANTALNTPHMLYNYYVNKVGEDLEEAAQKVMLAYILKQNSAYSGLFYGTMYEHELPLTIKNKLAKIKGEDLFNILMQAATIATNASGTSLTISASNPPVFGYVSYKPKDLELRWMCTNKKVIYWQLRSGALKKPVSSDVIKHKNIYTICKCAYENGKRSNHPGWKGLDEFKKGLRSR